jgi:hypothetical protein
MKLYVLFFDTNNGESREEWNVFYTPFEIFSSKALRDKRRAEIKRLRPELAFDEQEVELDKTPPNDLIP